MFKNLRILLSKLLGITLRVNYTRICKPKPDEFIVFQLPPGALELDQNMFYKALATALNNEENRYIVLPSNVRVTKVKKDSIRVMDKEEPDDVSPFAKSSEPEPIIPADEADDHGQ